MSAKHAVVIAAMIFANGLPQALRNPIGRSSSSGAFQALAFLSIPWISSVQTVLSISNFCCPDSSENVRSRMSERSAGGAGKKRSASSSAFSAWLYAEIASSSLRVSGGIDALAGLV